MALGILLVVLVAFIPTAIIGLIIGAAVNKDKGNDVSRFTNGVNAIYTYILIIASLLMIIIGVIAGINSLLDYFLPDSEVPGYCEDMYYEVCTEGQKALMIRNEKNGGIIGFATCAAIVLVALPIFTSNSKEAKRLREIKIEKAKEVKTEVVEATKKEVKVASKKAPAKKATTKKMATK